MTVLLELRVETEQFELGEHIARHRGLVAELERVVPTESQVLPYVWVTGPPEQLDALTGTLESSDAVSSVDPLDRLAVEESTEKQQLYRIEWVRERLTVVGGVIETDGEIMAGESVDSAWSLRIRFPSHDHVAQFYQHLTDNDLTEFSIHSVHEPRTGPDHEREFDLTLDQREALSLAMDRGYFARPREVTLEKLGEELGISEQAISQRLRRANEKIIRTVLNRPENNS